MVRGAATCRAKPQAKSQAFAEKRSMAIRTRLGAQRYNNRMEKIFENARRLERERLERGEMPNPSLTSPEDAAKYGWKIVGREVTKLS